ncbi:MAG: hypothetical protein ACFB3T_15130 [Geminicoccaceae bacterium]
MNQVPQLFIICLALVFALGTIALWAPRLARTKLLALIVAAAFIPLAYASMIELLSRPKPVSFAWWERQVEEADVLASRIDEGEAIFIWLGNQVWDEPRAFALPWDRELAEELQEAMRKARESGDGVRFRLPFEPSLDDGEPRFYALPQPALPVKPAPQDEGPMMFGEPVGWQAL